MADMAKGLMSSSLYALACHLPLERARNYKMPLHRTISLNLLL